MMSKLRFGIIGCGNIGARHAEQISRVGKLVAVCDNNVGKADKLAAAYSASVFYSSADLLKKENRLDVVAVCTPNGLHALHSIQSLEAGAHVLCEKPMAITVTDCKKMIAAAEKTGRKLMIVKQNRFNPPVMAVKKLLEEERLGKVFSVQVNAFWNRGVDYYNNSWRGTKDLDGGTLFTQFSHFVDLLYWMLGGVKKTEAVLGNYAHKGLIEFEDTGAVLLEFDNGVTGTFQYTVNSFGKNMEGSLTVFTERGTIKIGGQYLNEISYQSIQGQKLEQLPAGAPANDYGSYTGSMSNHDKVYDNLLEVINENGTIAVNAWEGMKTVEIIEKIYGQARYVK